MAISTLEIIKNILDREMELPQGRCFAYNNENDLPKDDNLFICLFFADRTPYSNNTKFEEVGTDYIEHQSISMNETIEVAIVSKNKDARERCHEILLAFSSVYSQQMQEKHHIHISTISPIYDNSFLEATARLNRFDVRVSVIRTYTKTKTINYYDKFSGELWVENGNNLIKKTV